MVDRIDHIDIKVHDVEAEVELLKLIGLKVRQWLPAHNNSCELVVPGHEDIIIEIHPCGDTEPGLRHVAFHSTDPGLGEKLEAFGVEFVSRNNYVASTGRTVTNFKDPSGIIWQITD